MKLSISGLVALAIAAPALGAVVARIEGDVTSDVVPGKVCALSHCVKCDAHFPLTVVEHQARHQ
jgi:hypothetical protein